MILAADGDPPDHEQLDRELAVAVQDHIDRNPATNVSSREDQDLELAAAKIAANDLDGYDRSCNSPKPQRVRKNPVSAGRRNTQGTEVSTVAH